MPSLNRKKKLQIFLSYAKEDKTKVQKLNKQLKEDGFDTWFDEDKLLPGHDWRLEIEKGQRTSDVILLCFSVNSIEKGGYVQREYKQAMDIQMEKPEGAIFVIPVRLDECNVPSFIQKIQWVDYPTQYERLLLSLKGKNTNNLSLKPSNIEFSKFYPKNKISRTIEADIIPSVDSLSYRKEILERFFKYIKMGESFYLIGGSGFGKTRLFDFVSRRDVLSFYLGDDAENTWIVKINPYLLETIKEIWTFYELLFRSLMLTFNTYEADSNLVVEITQLDSQIIEKKDYLLASRFFELIVYKLCHFYDMKLCFLFDEFDEAFRTFPRELFSELRAIREENRGKLSYIFFFRNIPDKLRSPAEVWAIYELFSQNIIGIGPYTIADTVTFIQQLETRYEHRLNVEKDKIHLASGGHAGLIAAIFKLLIENPVAEDKFPNPDWLVWLGLQQVILAECENILASINDIDRQTLRLIAQNKINKTSILVTRILALRGLLKTEENQIEIFSPLLKNFILSMEE